MPEPGSDIDRMKIENFTSFLLVSSAIFMLYTTWLDYDITVRNWEGGMLEGNIMSRWIGMNLGDYAFAISAVMEVAVFLFIAYIFKKNYREKTASIIILTTVAMYHLSAGYFSWVLAGFV